MKRLICVILALCLITATAGCTLFSGKGQESVQFYYQRAEYLYGQEDGVIAGEDRDVTGHRKDPGYMLRLYLAGPLDPDLVSPFPEGLQITDIRSGSQGLLVTLTDALSELPDAKQSVACACLALTCMDISGTESVTLFWTDHVVTLDKNSLTVFDSSAPQPE